VKEVNMTHLFASAYLLSGMLLLGHAVFAEAQSNDGAALSTPVANSSTANEHAASQPASPEYEQVQHRLARGWNTSDVHSVTTHVLLPEGLAIHIGLEHNSTEGGDAFLPDALIGRLTPGAEQVFWENTHGMAAPLTCAFPGRGIVGGSRVPGTETTWSFLPPRCRPSQSPQCPPPSSFPLISSGIDLAPLFNRRNDPALLWFEDGIPA